MPRSKPKTSAEGREQLSSSLARMASAPSTGKRVPITEIGFGQCRFVVDDQVFPALCCGEPTLGGSWCAQHRALVFVRVAAHGNGKKSAQEPAKAPAGPAEPIAANEQPGKPGPVPGSTSAGKASPADGRKHKSEHTPQADQERAMLTKDSQRPMKASAMKDRPDAQKGSAAHVNEATKASPKGQKKQAGTASTEPSERSLKTQKPASPKPRSAKAQATGKKTATARKGDAVKRPGLVKGTAAAAGKTRAAKQAASAKKTGAKQKSTTAPRKAPVKKAAAGRKSSAAKRTSPAKKPAAASKRKRR